MRCVYGQFVYVGPAQMAKPGKLDKVRNLGIVAHIDAGKTTVSERFLYYSGRIHKIGEVHEGETQMDWMPEERERGITITAAATTFSWAGHELHLIDTPGHVDFTIEVERSLRVLDGAVVVFSAVDGVEPQSETVWRQADKFHVPRLAFINKMDRVGADLVNVLDQMRTKVGARPALMQWPIYAEVASVSTDAEFLGAVDLLTMTEFHYTGDQSDEPESRELAPERQDVAARWRDALIEAVADVDDKIAEMYLAGETIELDVLKAAIRRATIAQKIVPVFCGAALRNRGIQALLDGVVAYLPSPLDVPPVQGVRPGSEELVTRHADDKEPLTALAFKVAMFEGRKTVFVRIYSGKLAAGDDVFNVRTGKNEKASRLFLVHADRREKLDEAGAGMIVAVMGLKDAATGDTLCKPGSPLLLERIDTYEPVISSAIELVSGADKDKLEQGLAKLTDEDPTFRVRTDEETGQLLISGMGELHLEIMHDRLAREYGVQTRLGRPQVMYRETVMRDATADGSIERINPDNETEVIFGEATVRVRPLPRGKGLVVLDQVPPPPADMPGPLRAKYPIAQKAAREGLTEAVRMGPNGYPMEDVEATLLSITPRDDVKTDVGWRIAAQTALRKAISQAQPAQLEPIMDVEIVTPEEFLGDVLGDLASRRAAIEDVGVRGPARAIVAKLPLRALFGYATAVRSASQGRATFTMKFSRFDAWQ